MTEEMATATIQLSIDGERFDARLTVPAGPTAPSRLLPTFRALSNAVVGLGVEKARLEGETVSCSKGCGACCRHLVHLSPAEATSIMETVDGLPPERRAAIERRFAEVRERLAQAGFLERLLGIAALDPADYDQFALE